MKNQEITVTTTVTPNHKLYTVSSPSATVTVLTMEYATLVSALIRSRYTDDAMMAIINNRMQSPDDEQILAEWQEMQQWRTESKEIAHAAIEEYGRLYPDV